MVTISGAGLGIDDIARVARGAKVRLSDDKAVLGRVNRSRETFSEALAQGQSIYGVTTLFGGMADQHVRPEQLAELQKIALWHHRSTTGPRLPEADVRAAMLLRANSLMKGVSAIRLEIIERYVTFLNAGATPHVHQHGSIGASGDLVPLSYIGAAVTGLHPDYLVDLDGETLDCHTALERLGLSPVELEPKEGLALNNGTGACTGIAANCVDRALDLTTLAIGAHALIAQAMVATSQSFDPFIHRHKAHPGQVWIAREMAKLLQGSQLIRDEASGDRSHRKGKLVQDRYSLRCLPQYFGPIIDALRTVIVQIEEEANSANDNPLIEPDTGTVYHTGNFLAQYTAVAMDQLRLQLAMLAKHLDAQIAILVTPEFNFGLSPCLVGNTGSGLNLGLKSLQIVGNALMPLICYYAQPIADRYPTHADQFNQNINSQAMNSANLAREAVDRFEHYVATSLVFAVQAVELRSHAVNGRHDAREVLSPATRGFYAAARTAAAGEPSADRPMMWDDLEMSIQSRVEGLLAGIRDGGPVVKSLSDLRAALTARG